MTKVNEIHAKIKKEGKRNATQEIRFHEIVVKGKESFLKLKGSDKLAKAGRQGDIYFHLVDSKHPHGPKLKTRQLALGSGKGASHIAGASILVYEGTKLPSYCGPRTFLGPFIVVKKRDMIKHGLQQNDKDRHGYVSLPKGSYQITHQMDARTGERVVD